MLPLEKNYCQNFYQVRMVWLNFMFTVIFALARTVGWISHWLEMMSGPYKLGRPRQYYTGEKQRDVI